MRRIPRTVSALALAGSLVLLPVSGAIHAASPTSKVAAKVHETSARINLTAEYIAGVLGIPVATLQQDLQAGQTILQIAGSKYSSAQDLATALLANLKTKLDHAAAAGKLSTADESQTYSQTLSTVETLVTTPHPSLATGQRIGDPGALGILFKLDLLSTLATSCNTTSDALTTAFQAGGKSVLAICQATNPSATASGLAASLTTAAKSKLDAAVGAGQMTAAQETQFLSDIQTNIATWLTTPLGVMDLQPKLGADFQLSLNDVAQVLGITPAVLQQDLQGGQTILQIAGSKYSSAQDLATVLLANLKTKLDRAVSAGGKLTAAQENQLYQQALSKVETLVTTPHPTLSTETPHGGMGEIGILFKLDLLSTLATSCNTTVDALTTAIQAGGKSVLAICRATNPSATANGLAAALIAAAQSKLAATAAASKAAPILADIQAHLVTWLTTPLPVAGAKAQA